MPNTGKNCFRGHQSNIKCARDGARCNSATVYSGHKPTNPILSQHTPHAH